MVQVEIGDEVLVSDALGGITRVKVIGYTGPDLIVEGEDGLTGWRLPEQVLKRV